MIPNEQWQRSRYLVEHLQRPETEIAIVDEEDHANGVAHGGPLIRRATDNETRPGD